jgi:hypothetical protein
MTLLRNDSLTDHGTTGLTKLAVCGIVEVRGVGERQAAPLECQKTDPTTKCSSS